MAQRTVSNKLVALAVIIILIAVAIGLDAIGWVKWVNKLSDVPVVGQLITIPEEEEEEEEELSPLAIENDELRQDILVLERELTESLRESNRFQEELIQLQEQVNELIAFKEATEAHQTTIKDLATLYREMKPASAAEIFKRLEDELIIEILQAIPTEQATLILVQMEPETASRLTAKMVD